MSIFNFLKSNKKKEESLWDKVYYERKAIWEKTFGSFPSEVLKLGNLAGIWPGGCLVQIFSRKLGGVWITSSFGLTNTDMPAHAISEYHKVKYKDGDIRYIQCISTRVPKEVERDSAGYGYEIAIVSKEVGMWQYMSLNTIIQMEILSDIGLLEKVHEVGAVTIDRVRIGEYDFGNFIIFEAPVTVMNEFKLLNGKAKLLLAMPITDNEMSYAMLNGQKALLNLLTSIECFPVGDLNRGSAIFR